MTNVKHETTHEAQHAAPVEAWDAIATLYDEHVAPGESDLAIAGLRLAYWTPDARHAARALENSSGTRDVRILLAHRPDAALMLHPGTRVDLTVAGHTHGGQVQLPLVGPPTIASKLPRHVGAGGLHELQDRRIYVSRGVGVERAQAPRLRLGAVPEVSVISLR